MPRKRVPRAKLAAESSNPADDVAAIMAAIEAAKRSSEDCKLIIECVAGECNITSNTCVQQQ